MSGANDSIASNSGSTPKKEKRISDLDLSNAKRGVWLVKVPLYIADRWERAQENEYVGKLTIDRSKGSPAVAFSLSDSIAQEKKNPTPKEIHAGTHKEIPKEHKFTMNSIAHQTVGVFTHTAHDPEVKNPGPEKLSLVGKVVQKAECRPISNNVYMSLKRESIKQSMTPARQTIQLDTVVNAYKPRANHATTKIFNVKKAEPKKLRVDKDVVMNRLFSLFEKHQYYNIKDLVKETGQPITYLKEILKEVCNYNLKNPHKNMWELKPEYRHYKEEKKEDEPEEENLDDDMSDDD